MNRASCQFFVLDRCQLFGSVLLSHDKKGVFICSMASSIRRFYARYPNLAPLATTTVLFGLSDVLAQKGERLARAREKTFSPSHDFLRTVAVAGCAPFFNGGPLLWFHRALDRVIGPEPIMYRAVPKMLAIQFIYMPLSVPFFIFLSRFFHLSLETVYTHKQRFFLTLVKTTRLSNWLRFAHASASGNRTYHPFASGLFLIY